MIAPLKKLNTPQTNNSHIQEAEKLIKKANKLIDDGELNDAACLLEKALDLNPKHAQVWFELASIYYKKEKYALAMSKAQAYMGLCPKDPEGYMLCAKIMHVTHNFKEFDQMCGLIERNFPAYHKIYNEQAELYSKYHDVKKAKEILEKIVAKNPKNKNSVTQFNLDFMFPYFLSDQELSDKIQNVSHQRDKWLEKKITIPNIEAVIPTINFPIAYYGINPKNVLMDYNDAYRSISPFANYQSPYLSDVKNLHDKRKIKVGFISEFLGQKHAVGHTFNTLLNKLNRENFEVVYFQIPGDRFSIKCPEIHVDNIIRLSNNFRQNIKTIEDEKADILFYADIGMVPLAYHLANLRLAPVQCVSHGHPITSGIKNLDYYISSFKWESETAQNFYSETLVQLPSWSFPYEYPKLPQKLVGKFEGLPDNAHLYICPHTPFKLSAQFRNVIKEILIRDPKAYVVYINFPSYFQTVILEDLKQSLDKHFSRFLVINRLSQDQFNEFLTKADVIIDSFPFGGGNTSMQSIAFDIPVVCKQMEMIPGRMTSSFYKEMGFLDCVAKNDEDYIQKAIKIASDKSYHSWIQQQTNENKHKLFANQSTIHEYEKFFQTALVKALS